jgi:quinol monooxygenase YgiN
VQMIISWGRVRVGMWDEFERLFLQADAETTDAEGLCCRWLLRDLDDADAGFAISVWSSAQCLEKYLADPGVREMRDQLFSPVFVGEYFRHPCEVRVVSPGATERLLP